jgi:hypothetical protein
MHVGGLRVAHVVELLPMLPSLCGWSMFDSQGVEELDDADWEAVAEEANCPHVDIEFTY